MIASETIYNNLLTLLAATQLLTDGVPSGPPCFLTASRRMPQVGEVGQAIQPAIYILEGEEEIDDKSITLSRYEQKAAVMIFFQNTGGPNQIASTQLNNLLDAVKFQLTQRTLATDYATVIPLLGGNPQMLGGVVYNVRMLGRVIKNEGLATEQGAIGFIVSILAGM